MQHQTLEQGTQVARAPAAQESDWASWRHGLERFANLLERRPEPVRAFSTMECYPARQRQAVRQPGSPLAIAFPGPAVQAGWPWR